MTNDRFLVYQNAKGFSCSKCGKELPQEYEKALEQFDVQRLLNAESRAR